MAVPQKIGLFGGSFDPVHRQHLELAKAALAQFELDQVAFIPAKQSPFKAEAPASTEDRAAMLKLAIADEPHFSIDQQELLRPAPSYTYDTVISYREQSPSAQLFLIIGSDQLPALDQWHYAEQILAETTLLVAPRPDYPLRLPPNAHSLDIPAKADSSTKIRNFFDVPTFRRSDVQTLNELLDPNVINYITEHHLYEK